MCGRRAGKSFTLALIAVYLAAFRDWRPCPLLFLGDAGNARLGRIRKAGHEDRPRWRVLEALFVNVIETLLGVMFDVLN